MTGRNCRKMYVEIEKIYLAYVLKHKPKRGKQVIFLMMSNGEG